MATEVVVPQAAAGEGMELTLARWLKREGDEVRAGEPLFELDSEKTTLEIEAVEDGILSVVQAAEGETVEPRQVVAYLLAPGEELPVRRTSAPAVSYGSANVGHAAGVTPKAMELALAHGVDLAAIAGTGPGGFITTRDVQTAIAERR